MEEIPTIYQLVVLVLLFVFTSAYAEPSMQETINFIKKKTITKGAQPQNVYFNKCTITREHISYDDIYKTGTKTSYKETVSLKYIDPTRVSESGAGSGHTSIHN